MHQHTDIKWILTQNGLINQNLTTASAYWVIPQIIGQQQW